MQKKDNVELYIEVLQAVNRKLTWQDREKIRHLYNDNDIRPLCLKSCKLLSDTLAKQDAEIKRLNGLLALKSQKDLFFS